MIGVLVVDITKNNLNDYTILGSYRLEDLANQPSSSLYNFLHPLKKETFADNERIVFYNYQPINEEVLRHLQNTLKYLDISEFFVIIVTNQLATKDTLSTFNCQLVSYQPVFNNNNQMCAHAWTGIHIWPNGTASPCCDSNKRISKPDGTLYNIKTNEVDDILNSPWMDDLREEFRGGGKPDNCSNCWHREALGEESKRTAVPYRFENIYGNINWEQEGQLMFLGGHLGLLCNLKCRICSSEFSSSIADEELRLLPFNDRKTSKHYIRLRNADWVSDDKFWQYVKSNAHRIKSYEFLGGEPFMLKQNLEFLQFLIDNDLSKDTIFYFSTNGTQYPDILDRSTEFKRLELSISIDNIGQRFEYERYGASWGELNSNLTRIQAQRNRSNNLKMYICTTVNIQNVLYLPEILYWIRTMKVDGFYLNLLQFPEYLAITNLTDTAKKLVLDRLSAASLTEQEQVHVSAVIKLIETSKGSDGQQFIQSMKHYDQIRNQNFAVTHTDIAKAMGYD